MTLLELPLGIILAILLLVQDATLKHTKISFQSYNVKKWLEEYLHMDYELMMNGNVKIGQVAPEFKAQTTLGEVNLKDYRGKWLVFFSHPGDFTPVCSITEE